jgi:hypothetical protein
MLTADVFVKTYPPDYDWLPTLWRSFARVTGYRDILVCVEEQYPAPEGLPERARVVRCRRCEGLGLNPALERLRAHQYSDAERFVFIDSDCVWSRPVDLQTEPTINLARPVVLWRRWEEAAGAAYLRRSATATLGYQPPVETMVRYPFTYPRDVLAACWDALGGYERLDTVESTDWDAIGCWAIDHMPDAVTPVHWHDAGPACVHQFWSGHRPTHPVVQAELGRLGLL